MKIRHINPSVLSGGASKAVNRINQSLNKKGIDSKVLVQIKDSKEKSIEGAFKNQKIDEHFLYKIRYFLEKNSIRMKKFDSNFSQAYYGRDIIKINEIDTSDIINIHLINEGFINIKSIKKLCSKKVVWTLHDMWLFTGGCYYSNGCKKYENTCFNCKYYLGNAEEKYTTKNQKLKIDILKKIDVTIVTCSTWLEKCAKNSKILQGKRILTIPNGVDTNIYKPINKKEAKKYFNISDNKKVILFGAMNSISDKRKGYDYLKKALLNLNEKNKIKNCELIVFGTDEIGIQKINTLTIKSMGSLRDDYSLALLYSAADIFVGPSLEEAFGQTFIESMSCETPVLAFDSTGPDDIITHKVDGYLAKNSSVDDLELGIEWLLSNNDENILGINARKKVKEKFSLEIIAEKYFTLYKEIINKKKYDTERKNEK